MNKLIKLLVITTSLCFAVNSNAEILDCKTSLLTTTGRLLDTRFHDQTKHPESQFFTFTVSDSISDNLYIHQNICITGKQINDRRLKGNLCLLVTTGAKTVSEFGTAPSEDPYFNSASDVVTFNVYHTSNKQRPFDTKSFLSASSEVTTPISSFRGTFEGGGGGLQSITITCNKG